MAAIDDWAGIAFWFNQKGSCEHLLEIGRTAAPDPAWGDRLRRIGAWRDEQALLRLVKDAPAAGLSPPMLQLVGYLLRHDHPLKEHWHRVSQAQQPADFWLNYNLGNALRESNPVEAAGFYRVALVVRPRSSAAYNGLGLALVDQQRLPEAMAACQKAIDMDPNYAHAYNNLGRTLYHQQKLPEAIAAFQKAIDLNPKDVHAYNNLGLALRAQKKVPEAFAAYNKAIELDPKYVLAYRNLGLALYDEKKVPQAIAAYRKAIDLAPKFAPTYHSLGVALREQHQLPEAVAALQKTIDLDPKVTAAYNDLGLALLGQKKLPEASAAFQKAIDRDPKYATAHNNLGVALRDQKRLDAAIAAYRKAIECNPQYALAYNNLGFALDEQKHPSAAIAAYQKAIEHDPKYAAAYNNLGATFRKQQQFREAIVAYRKAIDLDPNDALAHGDLGIALLMTGCFAEGVPEFQRAVDLLAAGHALRPRYLSQLKLCQAFQKLAPHVPVVVAGKVPAAPTTLLTMAGMCRQYQQRHATAVQLDQKAFQAKPALAEDASLLHRYHAASAATLAGTGQGEDAAKLADAAKVRLRGQARAWLRAELDSQAGQLKSGNTAAIVQAEMRLADWETNADLAAVRASEALAGLPTEERTAWNELWADVAATLKEARSRCADSRLEGALTTMQKSQVHPGNMVVGRTYVLDLDTAPPSIPSPQAARL